MQILSAAQTVYLFLPNGNVGGNQLGGGNFRGTGGLVGLAIKTDAGEGAPGEEPAEPVPEEVVDENAKAAEAASFYRDMTQRLAFNDLRRQALAEAGFLSGSSANLRSLLINMLF